ncbi:poly(A) RNA polymerase, mitochondrial-like [Styela clava]
MNVLHKTLVFYVKRSILISSCRNHKIWNKYSDTVETTSLFPHVRDARDVLMDPHLFHEKIQQYLMTQAKHSIVVEGDKNWSSENSDQMRNILESVGEIDFFSLLPGTTNRYVVQYRNVESANTILYQGKNGAIENQMVSIKTGTEPTSKKQASSSIIGSLPKSKTNTLHQLLDQQETMEDQMKIFTERNVMSSAEIRVRYIFLNVLKKFFAKHTGIVHVRPYGSSLSGAGRPGTDFDVVLLTKDFIKYISKPLPNSIQYMDTEGATRRELFKESVEVLEEIKHVLQHLPGAKNVKFISQARIPIVKFHFSLVNLSVDISANQLNSNSMLNVLNWYMRYDSRVLQVMIIIRKWAEDRNLLSHGMNFHGFTPFMLQMLILMYLMKIDIIPPMHKIGSVRRDEFKLFSTPAKFVQMNNSDSVEQIICGFFEHFARYGLMGYKMQPKYGLIRARPSSNKQLWITNPFDNSHNIVKNCNIESMNTFIEHMQKTCQIIEFRRHKLSDRDWGLNAILNTKDTTNS